MGEADHWLPPDHVQHEGQPQVVTRTSPTNIGMALLADLTAYDLGYLSHGALLDRVGRTFHTLRGLRRYRGHFYNWYDTRSLAPLEPRYVSSVDSGNLWAALGVLRAGLEELRHRPVVSGRLLDGVQDTLAVLAALRESSVGNPAGDGFDATLATLRAECTGVHGGGARWTSKRLRRIRAQAAELAASVPKDKPDLEEWTRALVWQCAAAHQDLSRLAFWADIPTARSSFGTVLRNMSPFPGTGALAADQRRELDDLCELLDRWDGGCTLSQLPDAADEVSRRVAQLLDRIAGDGEDAAAHRRLRGRLAALGRAAQRASAMAHEQLRQVASLVNLCEHFSAMDFRFLYDARRKLLCVGFNASQGHCDESYYDLLASECRLASFLAVSHGQLPLAHWFALGRPVTLLPGRPTLLSWFGSMFEYMMPSLFMPSYPATLLDASCHAAVRQQIRYGRRQGIPWGISESCCNLAKGEAGDPYRAFGVPDLSLAGGLDSHLVIAPYASALAISIAPREACANLSLLEQLGYLSSWGFYDAIDYTTSRGPAGVPPTPCRTVMAHHSGMTLLALAGALLGKPMQRRFVKDPRCEAHDLLLQERIPQAVQPAHVETAETVVLRPNRGFPDATPTASTPAAADAK